jgi:hypothetical protein
MPVRHPGRPVDDLVEVVQAAAAAQLFGVVHGGLATQHVLALGVGLRLQGPKLIRNRPSPPATDPAKPETTRVCCRVPSLGSTFEYRLVKYCRVRNSDRCVSKPCSERGRGTQSLVTRILLRYKQQYWAFGIRPAVCEPQPAPPEFLAASGQPFAESGGDLGVVPLVSTAVQPQPPTPEPVRIMTDREEGVQHQPVHAATTTSTRIQLLAVPDL